MQRSLAATALNKGALFGSSLSSNRAVECKPFLVSRLWFAGSSVVFAVDSSRRMMGLRRRNLPRCQTHAAGLGLVGATGSAEWFVHVPAGTPQHASGQAHPNSLDQAGALTARLNTSPDLSIACMMTASLRATATAARLKPIRSRSINPHRRRSLSA